MRYRRFGRTELQMPVFSTGGMRYQDGWTDKPFNEIDSAGHANLEATIHRSLEVGIHHIETARGYGPSERQLGYVLPKLPREQLIVQTKIGPVADADEFTKNFEDSLARLQLDHVDLLGVHGINNDETLEWATRPGGCFDAAQKLRERGLVRFVGFSTHGPTDVIVRAIEHGEAEVGGGFDYVNLHWYWIMQRNWSAIEAARARDMGVFIISPSDKGGKLYDPPASLVEMCKPLHPMVFNDLFCLAHSEVHTLSLGAARPSDYDIHLDTLPLLEDPQAHLAPIIDRLQAAMAEAVGDPDPEAAAMTLPPPEDSPGGLNLQNIVWLRNLARGWGLVEYGKMRFNLMGNGGHWFPGAKVAEAVDQVGDVELDAVRPGLSQVVQEAVDLLGGEEVQRASSG